jgi:hypothetical protein
MPDDRNVPVGGAGQTHSARVKFASDTVREKVGDLLAEAGGTLAAVNEDERRRVATRLRKAKGAAPLNLLPLLTLLLAACGKAAPDIAGQRPDAENGAEEDRSKEDGERAGPPGEGLSAEISSGEGSAGDDPSADDVSGGWRFIKASTRAGKPPLSPEAEANMVRLCLQAITDNSLQASAIHEICSLIDLDAVDRSHDVIWRWNAPPRTEGYSTNKVCYLVNAQDLLFWMFMESPAAATGYAGRVRPKSEPEVPGAEDGITDASLLTVATAPGHRKSMWSWTAVMQ